MMPHPPFDKPSSPSGYLEAMSLIIMTTGISWKVVEAKWGGIREAFLDFDIEKVAGMDDADVERLMEDRRVVRNRRKIHAIIDNAAKIAQLDEEHGGFDKYLRSAGSYEQAVGALKRDFAFMGDSTAYYFLAMIGETVPDWQGH